MSDTSELRTAAERGRKLYRESPAHVQQREQCALLGLLSNAFLADLDADCDDMERAVWWRGNNAGVRAICEAVTAILDGKDNGSGVCSDPWESLRRRLLVEHPVELDADDNKTRIEMATRSIDPKMGNMASEA